MKEQAYYLYGGMKTFEKSHVFTYDASSLTQKEDLKKWNDRIKETEEEKEMSSYSLGEKKN